MFLSLYPTKGEGLNLVISPLGIRGVLGELLVPDHLLVVAVEVGVEEQLGPGLHYNHNHLLVTDVVSAVVGG